MTFKIMFGVSNSVTGNSDEWGVQTVREAVDHPRAKSALGHPDNTMLFVNDIMVQGDHDLVEDCEIRIQKIANTKG